MLRRNSQRAHICYPNHAYNKRMRQAQKHPGQQRNVGKAIYRNGNPLTQIAINIFDSLR